MRPKSASAHWALATWFLSNLTPLHLFQAFDAVTHFLTQLTFHVLETSEAFLLRWGTICDALLRLSDPLPLCPCPRLPPHCLPFCDESLETGVHANRALGEHSPSFLSRPNITRMAHARNLSDVRIFDLLHACHTYLHDFLHGSLSGVAGICWADISDDL